ncbi:MAG: DUF424 domain-containing protein [Betaproteobacteria bacterium]|nr:DUF424 domain-containing protein [Betaproteobacteria bacterium]
MGQLTYNEIIQNHKTMTASELHAAMKGYLVNHPMLNHDFVEGDDPQNVNYMFAVWAIEADARIESKQDMLDLLSVLEKQCPVIAIDEGFYGGCRANSNQELIVQKIKFDIANEFYHADDYPAYQAAVELGWLQPEAETV